MQSEQVTEDDQYVYCGTTSGDVLQVSYCIYKRASSILTIALMIDQR